MNPIKFEEANHVWGCPESLPNCEPLHVFKGVDQDANPISISCWQMTPEELAEVNANGGKIYLGIVGRGHPPVLLMTQAPTINT